MTLKDLKNKPKIFVPCMASQCPKAKHCLRQVVDELEKNEEPMISVVNPRWLDKQTGEGCKLYISSEPIKRARGFKRTVRAIPSGDLPSFRSKMIAYMGYKRFYQCKRGEVLLYPKEEEFLVKLAQRYNVFLDEYFDDYDEVFNWTNV